METEYLLCQKYKTNMSEEQEMDFAQKLDNMRRSRDYFRLDRDNLKKLHEKMLNDMIGRMESVERHSKILDNHIDHISKEVDFLRDELDDSERKVIFYKTVAWVLAFFSAGLFGLIIHRAL